MFDSQAGNIGRPAVGPRASETSGPQARRDQITTRVTDQGFVRIEELARELKVTPMTIRRDLDYLQSQGWLRKVRGGATARPSALHHGDVRHRISAMSQAKQELARSALELIRPGQSVMLDESTTALALAELLPQRAPLTVITHFVPVISQLAGSPGIDLISLGGAYYPAYDAFLGLRTVDSIGSLHADLLIASTTAVTRGQCYHQSQETVAVKRAMMAACDRRVLLCDHTKFEQRGLYQLAPLTAFDRVMVDSGLSDPDLESLRQLRVEVFRTSPAVVVSPEADPLGSDASTSPRPRSARK